MLPTPLGTFPGKELIFEFSLTYDINYFMEIQGDKVLLSFEETYTAIGGALKLRDYPLSETLQELISNYAASESESVIDSPSTVVDELELPALPYEQPFHLDFDLETQFRLERALVAGKYFIRQLVRDSERELLPKPPIETLGEEPRPEDKRPSLKLIISEQ